MARRLFLLFLICVSGIINTSGFLMSADGVGLIGLDEAKVVETVPLPEFEPVADVTTPVVYETTSIFHEPAAYVEPVSDVAAITSSTIAVAGRLLEIVDVSDTAVDSGNHVNKYGDKFLYGHNSAGVFGGLVNLGVGNIFTVSYGGVSRNYQVAKIVVYEKDAETGKLRLDGAGNYMRSVANARSGDVWYDLSLMTCYGISYGNGDASHRLVVFANAI